MLKGELRARFRRVFLRTVAIPQNWPVFVFLLIFCVGLYLRLGPFVHKDLWQDELYSINFASRDYSPILHILNPLDDRPPLYYLFVKAQLLISHDKLFLRLPSLLSSLAVMVIVFATFRKKHPQLALTLASIAAVSPFLIDFSWQVRDYGVMLAVTAGGFWLLYQQMQHIEQHQQVTWKSILAYAVLTLIGCLLNYIYFVYSSIVLVMIAILGLLFFQPNNLFFRDYYKRLCLLHTPIFSIVAQYLLIQHHVISTTTDWIPTFSWQALSGFFATAGGLTYAFDVISPDANDIYLSRTVIVVAISLVGLLLFFFRKQQYQKSLQLLVYLSFSVFILTTLAMYVISEVTGMSLFLTKAFVPAAVFFMIGYGVSIYEIIKQFTRWLPTAILGILFIGPISYYLSTEYLNRYPALIGDERAAAHRYFTEALDVVRPLLNDDTQLIILPHGMQPLIMDYYFFDQKHQLDRLASFIYTKVTNTDVPLTHVRPFIPMRKIVIMSTTIMFDTGGNHYPPEYLAIMTKIRDYAKKLCGDELHVVAVTSQHTIESCEVKISRADQAYSLQTQLPVESDYD